jgi:hypothetical protein
MVDDKKLGISLFCPFLLRRAARGAAKTMT